MNHDGETPSISSRSVDNAIQKPFEYTHLDSRQQWQFKQGFHAVLYPHVQQLIQRRVDDNGPVLTSNKVKQGSLLPKGG